MVILSTKQMPQVVQLEEGGVRGTLKEYALVFLVLKLEAVEMALSLLDYTREST